VDLLAGTGLSVDKLQSSRDMRHGCHALLHDAAHKTLRLARVGQDGKLVLGADLKRSIAGLDVVLEFGVMGPDSFFLRYRVTDGKEDDAIVGWDGAFRSLGKRAFNEPPFPLPGGGMIAFNGGPFFATQGFVAYYGADGKRDADVEKSLNTAFEAAAQADFPSRDGRSAYEDTVCVPMVTAGGKAGIILGRSRDRVTAYVVDDDMNGLTRIPILP
jgi:hypothetical protein